MKLQIIKSILLITFVINTSMLLSQPVAGMVVDQNQEILIGATLYWEGTEIGTTTDQDGYFNLDRIETTTMLVISYVGFKADTIEIEPEDTEILIILSLGSLEEVEITSNQRDHFASTLSTINMETIGGGELKKAACCNLSESFETNGAVNVSYSDAVTGAKEIEMLGLRGTYSQMMLENRPAMRGLGYTFGMEYIPGTWVSNISIAKGASNVVNGYEGITGNINIELLKPFQAERFFVNGYVNHVGRSELNVHLNHKINKKWSIGTLLHGSSFDNEVDHNADSFLDMPKKSNLNGLVRAFYRGDKLRSQINIHALRSNHQGGQLGFNDDRNNLYGFELFTKRVEVSAKLGYIGFKSPHRSIGWINSATWHDNDGLFGKNDYDATEQNLYSNLIFQDIIQTTEHAYKLGANYVLDNYNESYDNIDYSRTESVIGVFGEYTYTPLIAPNSTKKLGILAGLRADYHNLYGLFIIPRLTVKYNFDENTVVRMNAGRGIKTARILAENIGVLASSRSINITENLQPEDAWNAGFNFTKNTTLLEKELSVSVDLYSTRFNNQVIIDRETNTNEVLFYNLKGRSFSNSFLASVIYNIYHRTELKLAYKYNDVQTTYEGILQQQPLVAKHRGLVTLDYKTKDKTWKFHTTVQIVGPQRLPKMLHENYSVEGQRSLADYHKTGITPIFATLNAQITKTYKNWDFYLGGENLTNYMQENPIIGATDPFNENSDIPNFDASQIFAPVMGAVVYAGFRYTLK